MDLQSWWNKQEEPQGLSRHAFMYNREHTKKEKKSRFRVEINYKPPQQNVIGMMLKVDLPACKLNFPVRKKRSLCLFLSTKLQSSPIHNLPRNSREWRLMKSFFSIHFRSCLLHLRLHSVNAMLKSEWSAWEKVNVGASWD